MDSNNSFVNLQIAFAILISKEHKNSMNSSAQEVKDNTILLRKMETLCVKRDSVAHLQFVTPPVTRQSYNGSTVENISATVPTNSSDQAVTI
ncbi:unnamed protein product, partial [Allacma fusca]